MSARRFIAACAVLLLACAAARAPKAGAPRPAMSAAPYVAVSFPGAAAFDAGQNKAWIESDAGGSLAGFELFVAAGNQRETPQTNGVAALTAECILRTPLEGVPLRDAITRAGATLNYTVESRTTRFYLESTAENLDKAVALFGRALAAPDFSPGTVAAGRASLGKRIDQMESNPLAVGVQMFRRAYYASGASLPALGNRNTVATLAGDDARAFFQSWYRRGGASGSLVGRVTPAAQDAVRAALAALPAGTAAAAPGKANPIPANPPKIVARRDVGAPIVVIGFAAPPPGSRDFGAALVLQALLTDAFERSSATTLTAGERSVGALYLYDNLPSSFIVYIIGTRVDPSLAIRELLVVSKTLAASPLNDSALRRFKTAAQGEFLNDATALGDRAYYLAVFGGVGLGNDPLNAALRQLDRTTASDVQRVAKRYLQRFIAALVLPRDAAAGV